MDPRIPQKVVPESALAPKGAPKGPKELKKDNKCSKITESNQKNIEKIAPKSHNILSGNEKENMHIT